MTTTATTTTIPEDEEPLLRRMRQLDESEETLPSPSPTQLIVCNPPEDEMWCPTQITVQHYVGYGPSQNGIGLVQNANETLYYEILPRIDTSGQLLPFESSSLSDMNVQDTAWVNTVVQGEEIDFQLCAPCSPSSDASIVPGQPPSLIILVALLVTLSLVAPVTGRHSWTMA